MTDTKTVYVSIGNSDDKLTQAEWSKFWNDVSDLLDLHALQIHGEWLSSPNAYWQNACWCIEIHEEARDWLRLRLADLAAEYRQDSIAWAEASTEFIQPAKAEAS